MTEAELVELDFEVITVSNIESQNGYDYYFYQKELCADLVLYSTDSRDVKDNNWTLTCWEIPAIKIRDVMHYKEFAEILKTIVC